MRFAATGTGLILVASLGIVRMPDLLTRMHASSKAGTLGASLILVAVAEGAFDDVPVERISFLERRLRDRIGALPEVRERIERGERLTDDDVQAIVELARETR